MDKKLIVLDNVDIVTYSAAVSKIVEKFYDEDGNYTPHFGRANAIGVFFNYFVDETSLDAYFADDENDIDVDYLLSNDECLKLYNTALNNLMSYRLDFANAYFDALEIVRNKNTTIYGISEILQKAITKIFEKAEQVLTEENLDKFTNIAGNFKDGNISAESIVEEFIKQKSE